MNYIYICNALPEEVNNKLERSVAGNKFSLNMAKALNEAAGDHLQFLSLSQGAEELVSSLCGGEIWPGKKLHSVRKGNLFFFSEIAYIFRLKKTIQKIIKEQGQSVIILENAPMAPAVCCELMKRWHGVPCFSITIDTPFTKAFSSKGLVGHVNYALFKRGQNALRHFNGLITFTKAAEKDLHIQIPCMEFAIGCTREQIPTPKQIPLLSNDGKKTVVYAGTLIYYNCIHELLCAFAQLGEDYQLHIYGYGPLEEEVRKMSELYSNIHFHGRFSPKETNSILVKYDLLINPRQLDESIENFTFPSKLVDYILSCKSVLTSDFRTMPNEYHSFLYIIREMTPEGIANAVKACFEEPLHDRQRRVREAVSYIKQNQTYDIIAKKILSFINGNL